MEHSICSSHHIVFAYHHLFAGLENDATNATSRALRSATQSPELKSKVSVGTFIKQLPDLYKLSTPKPKQNPEDASFTPVLERAVTAPTRMIPDTEAPRLRPKESVGTFKRRLPELYRQSGLKPLQEGEVETNFKPIRQSYTFPGREFPDHTPHPENNHVLSENEFPSNDLSHRLSPEEIIQELKEMKEKVEDLKRSQQSRTSSHNSRPATSAGERSSQPARSRKTLSLPYQPTSPTIPGLQKSKTWDGPGGQSNNPFLNRAPETERRASKLPLRPEDNPDMGQRKASKAPLRKVGRGGVLRPSDEN